MEVDFSGLTKLVQACAKANVKKIKLGDIEIDFTHVTIDETYVTTKSAIESLGDGASGQESAQATLRLDREEQDDQDLLLTDPLEFERVQMSS